MKILVLSLMLSFAALAQTPELRVVYRLWAVANAVMPDWARIPSPDAGVWVEVYGTESAPVYKVTVEYTLGGIRSTEAKIVAREGACTNVLFVLGKVEVHRVLVEAFSRSASVENKEKL